MIKGYHSSIHKDNLSPQTKRNKTNQNNDKVNIKTYIPVDCDVTERDDLSFGLAIVSSENFLFVIEIYSILCGG